MKSRLLTALAAFTILGLVLAACTIVARSRPPLSVLFVSIDTLRADRLHCYGNPRETSPTIDAIARDGVLFRNASAQKGSTWTSLTSVLTGKYPVTHGVRKNGDPLLPEHQTIAQLLQAQGYRTGAFLANMTTAPNRGFDTSFMWEDAIQEQTLWDREVTTACAKWLRAMPPGQKFFGWVHLMDPHKPYHPPPPYDVAFDPKYDGEFNGDDDQLDDVTLGRRDMSPRDFEHVLALYDGQILSCDRYVAKVMKTLEATGRLDDTIVVFFSDHGEELCDHNHFFFHTCSMYDGVTRIALAMRLPGALPKGKIVDAQVEEIDVLPTVMELLDLPVPRDVQGESLVLVANGRALPKNPFAFVEYAERPREGRILSIRDGRWKYISNPTRFEPRNPPYDWNKPEGFPYEERELYDLSVDPREQKNLVNENKAKADELHAKLMAWYAPLLAREGSAGRMNALQLRQLQAVGYVGTDAKLEITLKDGKKIVGRISSETTDGDAYIVATDDGDVKVKKADIASIEER
jgi:arylsulfatase A-like enzyme